MRSTLVARIRHLVLAIMTPLAVGCTNGVPVTTMSSSSSAFTTLTGAPSNYNSLSLFNVGVSGSTVTYYKYQYGPVNTTDCTILGNYSAEIPVSTSITITTSVDDDYLLCVIGRGDDNVWQSELFSTQYTWTRDTLMPYATIDQPTSQGDPTSSSTINFNVTFSEPIDPSTVDPSDFIIFGVGTGYVSSIATSDNTIFNITVVALSEGSVSLDLPSGRVSDFALNSNVTTSSYDNTVTYDITPPTLTVSSPVSGGYVNSSSIFASGSCESGLSVVLTGSFTGSPLSTVCSAGVYGQTLTLSAGDGSYNITTSQTDGAGNSTTVNTSFILDSTPPTIQNVTVVEADGTYTATDTLTIKMTFSENVDVIGAPQLLLETGPVDYSATYQSGSGTKFLVFSYTVQSSDDNGDLDYFSASALLLSGGSISDVAANSANLTLPSVGGPGSIGHNKNIVIIGTPALLSLSDLPTYDFGAIFEGTSSSYAFTLTNSGYYPATSITALSLTGPFSYFGGAYPGTGGSCGATLAAGASCTLVVEFSPVSPAVSTSNVSLNYFSGLDTQSTSRAIQGTGLQNDPPKITSYNCMREAYASETYDCSPTSTGTYDPPDATTWSFSSNTCGSWISISASDGFISGTPGDSDAGTCDFEVVVHDGYNPVSAPWKVHLDIYGNTGITQISSGADTNCIVVNGEVKCWGNNNSGQLGNYKNPLKLPNTYVPAPVYYNDPLITRLSSVTQVDVGNGFTCARINTGVIVGALYCWGRNDLGQLGDGTTINKLGAAQVPGLSSGVHYVSASLNYACALLADRSVKCWGFNSNGIIGNSGGFSLSFLTPQTVVDANLSPLSSAIQIVTANTMACALTSDRRVLCWGDGAFGQLGQEFPSAYSGEAIEVLGFTLDQEEAVSLSTNQESVCAHLTSGMVKCWGKNAYGNLAIGNSTSVGNNVGDMSSLAAAQLGDYAQNVFGGSFHHSCAIMVSGDVRCWGLNIYGQLGYENTNIIGDTENVGLLAPVDISFWGTIKALALGDFHTCALADKSVETNVLCWGKSAAGQLGIPASTVNPNIGDAANEMGTNLSPVIIGGNAELNQVNPDIDVSTDGLTAIRNSTLSGAIKMVSAPVGFEKNSGKWYFEVTVGTGLGAGDMRVGLFNASGTAPLNGLGSDTPTVYSCGFDFNLRKFYVNNLVNGLTFGPSIGVGEKIGFAIDLSVWPYTVSVYNSTASQTYSCPLTGTNPLVVPAASLRYLDQQLDFNFGQNPFSLTAPTGFTSGWIEP